MFNVTGKLSAEQIVERYPEVFITPEAYFTMQQYAKQCASEISWFSRVINPSANKYIIVDAILLEQTVSQTSAEFSEEELSTFMTKTITEKGIEFFNEVKCWGHSHVNMSVYPSAQDLKQILSFSEQSYYIMLIINKQGDAHIEFYDFDNNTVYKNIRIQFYLQNSDSIEAEVRDNIKRCVKYARIVRKNNANVVYGNLSNRCNQMEMFPKQNTNVSEQYISSELEEVFYEKVDNIVFVINKCLPDKKESEIRTSVLNTIRSQSVMVPFKLPHDIQEKIVYMLYDIYDLINEDEIDYLLDMEGD